MNRGIISSIFALILVFSMFSVVSALCKLDTQLVSQDPYPAIPGDYVKVTFKVTGAGNTDCQGVSFDLIQNYPFSLDPSVPSSVALSGNTFVNDYTSSVIVPYRVRVDSNALDGENTLTVKYSGGDKLESGSKTQEFNITVKDSRTDFEVGIKDYSYTTRALIFEILNSGKHDVKAVTLEVPKQDNLEIKGSNRNIVGSLDANDDTTASFEAIPKNGEIKLNIIYTDEIGVRRTVQKEVMFDSNYFTGKIADQKSTPWITYLVLLVVIVVVAIFFYRRSQKKKEQKKLAYQYKK